MAESQTIASERVIRVDQEHIGLRLLVPLLTVFACAGTYWVGLQITAASDNPVIVVLLVFPAAIGAGLGVAWLAERALKRVWPSNRALTLDANGVTLRKRGATEAEIVWNHHVNVLAWRFTIPPRRGRVPKGWYLMACQLSQDDAAMTVYAFLPPEDAREMDGYEAFVPLVSRKIWEKASSAERLAMGEQSRLHIAETDRWNSGAELAREDFVALMQVLRTRLAVWDVGEIGARPTLTPEHDETRDRPPSRGNGKPVQL